MRIWGLILLAGCRGFFDVPPVAPDGSAAAPDAPAAPFTYVQSAISHISGGTTVSVALPLAQTAGNANIVVVAWDGQPLQFFSDTQGNSYVSAVGPTSAGSGWVQQIYVATNIKGGSNTLSATLTTSGVIHVSVLEYGGAIAAVDATASRIGDSSMLPTTGSLTTTNAHELMFAAVSCGSTVNTTMITGYTSRASDIQLVTADLEESQTGMYSAGSPATTSNDWVMQLVGLRAQ